MSESAITIACRHYRMRCIGHRLRKFGFERHINTLSTEDLRVLAMYVYPHQSQAIMKEVALRDDACEYTVTQ